MRLLRARHDYDDSRPVETQRQPESRPDRRSFEREYLPLLRLHQRFTGSRARRKVNHPGPMKTYIEFSEPERYELHEGPRADARRAALIVCPGVVNRIV